MIFLAFRRTGPSPSREALLKLIAEYPGCTKADLCRITGLSWGAVSHHIRYCSKLGEIRQVRTDRKVFLYSAGIQSQQMPFVRLLRDETNQKLVSQILEQPGIGINSLSKSMDISRKIIRRHLADLVDVGILQRSEDYRPRFNVIAGPREFPQMVRRAKWGGLTTEEELNK